MKISIFGTNNIKKSIFSRRVIEAFGMKSENYTFSKKFQNNYFEDEFLVNGKSVTIRNLPYIRDSKEERNNLKITEKVISMNEKLISDSDYLIILIDSENIEIDNVWSLIKKIKSFKKYSLVFLSMNSEEEKNQKFSMKNSNEYNIPLFPISKSKEKITNFFKKEFNIYEIDEIKKDEENTDNTVKTVVFGPPNSGKSSLLNCIIGYERSVVSEVEGTTRENVKSFFKYKESNFSLLDTEGILNKSNVHQLSSQKLDLMCLVVDSTKPITKNILQMADISQRYSSSLIILMNKVDLLDEEEINEKEKEIRFRLKSFSFVPIVQISAKTGKNFSSFFSKLESMINQSKIYLTKKTIVNYSKLLIEKNQPSILNGKRLKIYYGIHEKGFVNKIIFFVNDVNCIHFSYQRYILKFFRKNSGIENLPIKIFFKKS